MPGILTLHVFFIFTFLQFHLGFFETEGYLFVLFVQFDQFGGFFFTGGKFIRRILYFFIIEFGEEDHTLNPWSDFNEHTEIGGTDDPDIDQIPGFMPGEEIFPNIPLQLFDTQG